MFIYSLRSRRIVAVIDMHSVFRMTFLWLSMGASDSSEKTTHYLRKPCSVHNNSLPLFSLTVAALRSNVRRLLQHELTPVQTEWV